MNGTAAPLFYTSYGQIAFQMPVDTPLGTALVQVQRDDGAISNKASVAGGRARAAAARHRQPGRQHQLRRRSPGARPATSLTSLRDRLRRHQSRPSRPALAAPSAEPLARVTPTPVVGFGAGIGKIQIEPLFAGLTPGVRRTVPGERAYPAGFPDGRQSTVAVSVGEVRQQHAALRTCSRRPAPLLP